ncbi:MAG: glycosyltransferase, partial [Lachnospiraceae bacterium]|nr:glycosyltransferase [Lachnospiraceae bacterium]
MARLPVSVCLIAKNEERYIEQCLRKLLRYDMEIVVVDTGSTDRTKEIAEKYT